MFHFSSQSATCDRSSVLCWPGAVRAHPFIGSALPALPQPGDKVRAGNGPHAVCYDENGLFCTERERVRPKQRIHFRVQADSGFLRQDGKTVPLFQKDDAGKEKGEMVYLKT